MEEDEEKSDDSSDHHGSVEDCKSSTEVAYEPDIWGTHIAVSILDSVFRIVFLVLTLFLLYEGVTKGYWLGHEIFNPTAVEAEPGRMRTVTIEESESTSEAGEALERVGLIQSRVVFVLQAKIYEYKIYPGTYQFSTAQTSLEMLKEMDEAAASAASPEEDKSDSK